MQRVLGRAVRALEPLAAHADEATPLAEIAAGNDRLTPLEQVEIYRHQFWLRHRDCLYEDYPGLAHLLGEEAFESFLRAYLRAHPPDSYTLRDLGNHIADFAAGYAFEPAVAGAARDMARFELAFVDLFDAADVPPLAAERAAALPPEAWSGARLGIHPHLRLLVLDHAVHVLRRAVRAGEDPPRQATPGRIWLAMYRASDLCVHHQPIGRAEHALLEMLRGGVPLADACERVSNELEPAERDTLGESLHGWFERWGRLGWIVDVTPD
jgi:hypothetical protein